jgi:branched-chain amino acid aminotransferase
MTPVWLNGRLLDASAAAIPAGDFGFLYGEGLFETMRASDEGIAYLDRHLSRLRRSAERLGLPLPEESDLRWGLAELRSAAGGGERRVRLTVTRGSAGNPFDPAPAPPTVLIVAQPIPPRLERWRAVYALLRRDETNPLRPVKSVSYFENLWARREARSREADEALFLNSRGELVEGAATNLFLLKGEELFTPPESAGGLPGISRSVILDRAGEIGLRAAEAPLFPSDLEEADAAFLTNAVMGAASLVAIEGKPIGDASSEVVLPRLRSLLWRSEDFQRP